MTVAPNKNITAMRRSVPRDMRRWYPGPLEAAEITNNSAAREPIFIGYSHLMNDL
jgi:hypothetical protein